MITLLLGLTATALGGAYIGTVVANATEAPNTVIQADKVQANTISSMSNSDLVKYGLMGVGAYFIYKKVIKKGK